MLRKRLFELGLLVALLAGLLFSVNLTAQAQEDGTDDGPVDSVTVQFTGTVGPAEISIGEDGIMVDGVKVAPAGVFQPSNYKGGECVTVTGVFLNDDVLQATLIEPSTKCGDEDEEAVDTDGDGIPDDKDSCPNDVNWGTDSDDDGIDDACDTVDNSDDENQDQEMEGCTTGNHPVLEAYVGYFEGVFEEDVTYTELETWHCDGMGLGEIGRALLMAQALDDGTTYDEILQARAGGESWGAIKKEYDISGSDMAPGHAISAQHSHSEKNTEQNEEQNQEQNVAPGNSGEHSNNGNSNNSGHGNTPPGQDKNKDKSNNGQSNQDHGKGKNK